MIHIYKKGGVRGTTEENAHTIEAINDGDFEAKHKQGWRLTLDEALAVEKEQSADANGDGTITLDEAKAYAADHNIDIEGIHHKTVIKMVKDHMNLKAE